MRATGAPVHEESMLPQAPILALPPDLGSGTSLERCQTQLRQGGRNFDTSERLGEQICDHVRGGDVAHGDVARVHHITPPEEATIPALHARICHCLPLSHPVYRSARARTLFNRAASFGHPSKSADPFAPLAALAGSLLVALRAPHPASRTLGHFRPLRSHLAVPQFGNAPAPLPNQPQFSTVSTAVRCCQAADRPRSLPFSSAHPPHPRHVGQPVEALRAPS
jgi:hypothetical protein